MQDHIGTCIGHLVEYLWLVDADDNDDDDDEDDEESFFSAIFK
jgi:hypothetical protein